MSSTKRTKDQVDTAADFYPTPYELCHKTVAELMAHKLVDPNFGPALEPSVGTGNWVRALRANGFQKEIVGVEKHAEYHHGEDVIEEMRFVQGDFLDQSKLSLLGESENNENGGFGLIIGNPPFSQAGKFIRHALTMLRPDGVLALLLRYGWFSQELERDKTPRRTWLWGRLLGIPESSVIAQPIQFHLVMPRPRFGGKSTDSATYVIAVWMRPWDLQEAQASEPTPPKTYPIIWRERRMNAIERRKALKAEDPIEEETPIIPECPDTLRDPDAPIPYVPTEPDDVVAGAGDEAVPGDEQGEDVAI